MMRGLLAGQGVDHGDRLNGRVVVQAQNHQIDLRHQLAFGLGVLAPLGRDAQQFDARHRLKPFANLQAGGAGFAVDEDGCHGRFALSVLIQRGTHIIMHYASWCMALLWCSAA